MDLQVTQSRGMSHTLATFNFDFQYKSFPVKVLHFDANPISIGHLVAEI